MGSRLASSFSVDEFVQTPVRSVVLHDVAIQLPITEFFIGCVFSNDPLDRQNFVRQSPSSAQDDIGSDLSSLTCTITRPNLDCVDLVRKLAPRALLQPPSGLEQLAPPPGLATGSHLYTTHGAFVSDAPPRARLRSAISVMPPQPSACTTHVGSHHLRSATIGKRSASTALVVWCADVLIQVCFCLCLSVSFLCLCLSVSVCVCLCQLHSHYHSHSQNHSTPKNKATTTATAQTTKQQLQPHTHDHNHNLSSVLWFSFF